MAKYGNILIVKDCNDAIKQEVSQVIMNNNARFKDIENVYFIETNSVRNTKEVTRDFKKINMKFVFYRNKISDGSIVSSSGFDSNMINEIKDLIIR